MRTASLVLGIIAGFLAMLFGGVGVAVEGEGAGTIVGLGFAAVFIGVVAIVGGALPPHYPKVAAILQLFACVAGFVAVSLFWIFSGILLLIGAGLAFFGRKSRPVTLE